MKKASRPKGTRDFLPDQMRQRQQVIGAIRSIFESYGYEPLETPALEKWETLKGKLGEEGDQLLFKILRRGTAIEELRLGLRDKFEITAFEDVVDFALRYDLTVPLSRVLAMNPQLPRPFKRYQIQPVWRADRPQKGRYCEFYQCDVDVVGSDSMLADAEIIGITSEVLTSLGFTDFRIRLNHRKLLNGLVAAAGGEDHFGDICIALDKLDKIGVDGVSEEMLRRGVSQDTAKRVLDWSEYQGPIEQIIADIRPQIEQHPDGKLGLQQTLELYEAISSMGVDVSRVPLDLSLVRGLDYYTGPIFESVVDTPAIGSLSGGGRYDGLIAKFSGIPTPATGTTIGLERVIDVMQELQMLNIPESSSDLLVTVFAKELLSPALSFAKSMRKEGFRVEVYLKPGDKLSKQIKSAADRKIPVIAIIGPDEASQDLVMLRTGPQNQYTVPCAEAAAQLRTLLNAAMCDV